MRERSKQVFVSVTVFLFMIMTAIVFSTASEEMKVSFYYMEDEEGFKFVSAIEGSNYTWEFGDGSIGYGKEVFHDYASEGIYQVNLTVKGADGTIFESQMINTANNAPVADFYFSPEYPYTLQDVFFWDNSTDSDGYIINWTWNFGDGNMAYGPFVNHTYMKAGNYTVQLTVVDNQMKADSVSQIVVVRNRLPVPKFYWTRNPDGELEFRANFPFDPSYDEDGTIVNYTWDMGDGTIKYGAVVHHSYSKTDQYTVTLIVRDDDNGTASTSRKIHSNNAIPDVKFRWEPEEPTDLDNVTFISESTDDGTIERYIWELGDGNTSYNQTVIHRYAEDGYYMVRLTLIDDEGAFNYSQKTIFIKNVPPIANFTYSPPYPVPNKKIVFNASSSYDLDGDVVEWRWDFGDGSVGYGMVVNHSYGEDGVYVVNLTVKDNDGAEAYMERTILLADLYVDENVFDPANKTWNRIQDAVDNASDGYFIYVRAGTYEEDVYINKSIMIEGINAVLKFTSYGFYLDAPDIIISNFTISGGDTGIVFNSTGGILENTSIKAKEMGILFEGNQNVLINVSSISQNTSALISSHLNVLQNSLFQGNVYGVAIYGAGNQITHSRVSGGIYALTIYAPHNVIDNNTITDAIYGVYMMDSGNIYDNRISNCSWGIKINSPSLITIGDNRIENCSTAGIEGITDFTVTDAFFKNNAISILSQTYVEADNVSICGGDTGISMMDGEISSSTIHGCIYGIDVEGNASIWNTTLEGCEAGIKGEGEAEILDTTFVDNGKAIADIICDVERSDFSHNDYGFYGEHASISNSTFVANDIALYVMNNSKIYNNSFTDNGKALLIEGKENHIWNNTLEKNQYGIILDGKKNSIINNMLADNIYGIRIIFAPSNLLMDNTMENNTYNLDVEGSKLEHFYLFIDESNTINGKEIKYVINQTGFTLDEDYGYIALINCSVVVIKNANISNNGEGIMLIHSRYVTISGCVVLDSIKGIYSLNGNGIDVDNVKVKNNDDGISFKSTSNVSIKNAKIEGNSRGINLFFMERGSAVCEMENISFTGNILAINIENMEDVNITDAIFDENEKGIRLFNSNVSLDSINMGDTTALHLTDSWVEINNFDISATTAIYSRSSTMMAADGTIKNSSAGIKGSDSFIHLTDVNIYENIEGFNLTTSEISMDKCNISGNENNILRSCVATLKDMEFGENGIALNVTGSEVMISNSTFFTNKEGIAVWNSTFNAFNLTLYENDLGVTIHSSSSIISEGEMFNNTVAIKIDGNENMVENLLLHHNSYAIILYGFNNTVKNNSIWKNLYGVITHDENIIYHNNFISNTEDAKDYGHSRWNLSYPTGGNYWDSYAGEDYLMGEGQNESGSDGIGDIPHQFYGNMDYYPLMDYYENASGMPNVPPEASFYFYPPSPFTLQNIIFIDTSRDENGERDMLNWYWDFGDGNSSEERNPSHFYQKSGRYNITLKVTDRSGAESTFVREIVVKNLPPVANFTFQPENPHSFTLIEFNASESVDKDGTIVNYTWDMGDGTIKHGSMITHKYSKPGTYEVKLTVVDNEGNESIYALTITVDNRAPEANFIISPENPKEGEEINFTDLSSDLDGKIVEWRWDFGDGTISYTEDAVHVYKKPGEYTVTLEVKDSMGAKANYSMTIKVGEKEMPGFGFVAMFAAMIAVAMFYRRLKKFK